MIYSLIIPVYDTFSLFQILWNYSHNDIKQTVLYSHTQIDQNASCGSHADLFCYLIYYSQYETICLFLLRSWYGNMYVSFSSDFPPLLGHSLLYTRSRSNFEFFIIRVRHFSMLYTVLIVHIVKFMLLMTWNIVHFYGIP